jgi:hypothetical protein
MELVAGMYRFEVGIRILLIEAIVEEKEKGAFVI